MFLRFVWQTKRFRHYFERGWGVIAASDLAPIRGWWQVVAKGPSGIVVSRVGVPELDPELVQLAQAMAQFD